MVQEDQHLVYFDWIKQGDRIDRSYVPKVVRKVSELSCDVIIFGIQEGGYVCYDSTVSPKIPYVLEGVDVLRCLVEEAHKEKIKVIPMWLETVVANKEGGCGLEAKEHPDWQQRLADGEKVNHLCFNSPFRDYQLAQVREVLEKYEVDGVYFDQFPMSCYCEYCKARFKKEYGYDMPVQPLPNTKNWKHLREFKQDSIKSFCTRVRYIIKECRPEAAFVQNVPHWEETYIPEIVSQYADALVVENYLTDKVENLGLKGKLTEAYARKPVWFCQRHVVRHDAAVNPIAQTQLLLAVAISDKFSPTMLEFGAFDYSMKGFDDLKQTFSHACTIRDSLRGSEPVKYCALLHSKSTERFYRKAHLESLQGIHQLLVEQHIPFGIITEDQIQSQELSNYKVLVLPNAVCLQKPTVKEIELFVQKGGGLVATFMSGLMDEEGMKRDGLATILGRRFIHVAATDIKPFSSLDRFINYCRVRKEQIIGRDLSDNLTWFFGGFVEAVYDSQCKVIADILEADQSKINMSPYNRRGLFPGSPGWPLLALKESPGKTAYFSAEVGAELRRSGNSEIDQLITETILWAGNSTFPVTVEHCPKSVQLVAYYHASSKTFTIILTNLTTGRIQKGGLSGSLAVFKYVVPVSNLVIRLDIQGRSVKKVVCVTGQSLTTDSSRGQLTIKIPELNIYECVTVEIE